MGDLDGYKYVLPNGETVPVADLLNTSNIQDIGIDWYKQDDVYKRCMCLSHLPNDVSVADLRALAHAEGIDRYSSIIANRPEDSKSDQTSLLSAQISTLINVLEQSSIFRKARNKILSKQADDTTEKISEHTLRASILFRLEADSKVKLDDYTENVSTIANEIGVEVIPVEESPEVLISAMEPFGAHSGEIGNEYCITVDAAKFAMLQSLSVPQELLDELYDDDKNPIYIYS